MIGTRLDQVAAVELNGIRFAPAGLSRVDTKDELRLSTDAKDISTLHAGDKVTARTSLKDGRVLNLEATIDSASSESNASQQNHSTGAVAFGDSAWQSG